MNIDPTVLVACITGFCTIIAALVGRNEMNQRQLRRQLHSVAVDARTAREQVTNEHETNLRDDFDRLEAKVDSVTTTVDSVSRRVNTMHDQVVALNESDIKAEAEHGALWRAIRQVLPPSS